MAQKWGLTVVGRRVRRALRDPPTSLDKKWRISRNPIHATALAEWIFSATCVSLDCAGNKAHPVMIVNQSDLDSFHDFATHLLAKANVDLSLDEIVIRWCAEREQSATVESIPRGVADADAGRVHDLADI